MTRRVTITGTRNSRKSPDRENELRYTTFPYFWGPNPPKRRVGEVSQKEPCVPPTLPQGPPKLKDVAPERSQDALGSTFGASLLSFRFFSASFPPLGPIWYHLDLKHIPISLRRSSNSSFSLVSLRTQPWVTKFHCRSGSPPTVAKSFRVSMRQHFYESFFV